MSLADIPASLAYEAAARPAEALARLEEWKVTTDGFARADMVQAVVSRQATHELEQQCTRLAGQAAMLLAEVHHRVKNNLAIVTGLLRLQARRLSDPAAARAVRESQQRVEAMSLIHQGLCQADDVTAVDMHRYVTDLVHSLSAAYGFAVADLDLALDVVPLRLDVDVAVPLGLLLNELLTNAFKYAVGCPRASRPMLRVALGPAVGGGLALGVQDNGPGFDPTAAGTRATFGHRLVAALAGQLGGQLTLDARYGTHYCLAVSASAPAETPPIT